MHLLIIAATSPCAHGVYRSLLCLRVRYSKLTSPNRESNTSPEGSEPLNCANHYLHDLHVESPGIPMGPQCLFAQVNE